MIATTNSDISSPTFLSVDGSYHGQSLRRIAPVVITGAAVACPDRSHLRRRQRRPHAATAISSSTPFPTRFRTRHARQAHHPAGEERQRRPHLRDRSRNLADVIKLAGRGGAFDLERGVRHFRRPRRRPRPRHLPRHRAPESTRCATPASRWSCATRPPPRARNCPTAGACPTPCATTPA